MNIPIILAEQGDDQIWREAQRVSTSDYSYVECLKKFRLPKTNIAEIINTLLNNDTSNVSQPSCCRIIHQFCKFFIQHYFHLVKWYDNQEDIDEAKKKYLQSYGVKGLLGIIDGTMMQIKGVSGADEPAYICRKGYPALDCQVVVDYDGMFRDVVVKYPGLCHDAFIYSNSILKQTLEYDPNAGFLFAEPGYGSR
ncbi:putative nuclease HARBI1 [Hydra vulgaris]|uniref:Nuclease HARBI1 n=1 Tax=Hydra vulgaris TaxID=6087 RepID=A0ABM4DHX3_HYDVU